MDFITHLPNRYNYNAILVTIDRLTKIKHFLIAKKPVILEKLPIYTLNISVLQVLLHCRGLQAPQSTSLSMLPHSVSILEGSILTLLHSGRTIASPP
jgi:hypothetical protein